MYSDPGRAPRSLMAKSRAKLVIWCLAVVSLVLELVKWRRAGVGAISGHDGTGIVVDTHHSSVFTHREHHDSTHRVQSVPSEVDSRVTSGTGEVKHDDELTKPILATHTVTHSTVSTVTGGPERVETMEVSSTETSDEMTSSSSSCSGSRNTEFAGDVVANGWGSDPRNKARDATECCERCKKSASCNVWVFCDPSEQQCAGDKKGQCWLKKQELWVGMDLTALAKGNNVGWTSGADFSKAVRMDTNVDFEDENELSVWFKPIDVLKNEPEYSSSEVRLSTRLRECGDPAIDGYAHVNATCLEHSETAVDWEDASTNVAWYEEHASFDGLAVRWGIGHKKKSASACAKACLQHIPLGKQRGGPFGALPCSAFVWCPIDVPDGVCFEPDAHTHGPGDCWLKFTEVPESVQVNQRGRNNAGFFTVNGRAYSERHPNAPSETHWISGVVLPIGWTPGNGTFGPRAKW